MVSTIDQSETFINKINASYIFLYSMFSVPCFGQWSVNAMITEQRFVSIMPKCMAYNLNS